MKVGGRVVKCQQVMHKSHSYGLSRDSGVGHMVFAELIQDVERNFEN